MGLFSWLKERKTRGGQVDASLAEWRRAWAAAAEDADAAAADSLAARLAALGYSDEDVEIEREMMDGLRELIDLRVSVDSAGFPIVETGHRVVGADRCHFSAPASLPDDDGQPSGRLLLTPTRAIFVGGGRTTSVPWHTVGEARYDQRDVLLIRKTRDNMYRFRCNSFADALRAAFLSRRLAASRQPATSEKRS